MDATLSPEPDLATLSQESFRSNSFAPNDNDIEGVANATVQRYTRPALYLLRNNTRSRKRPECALRNDLQSLGVWKFNNGNNQQNGSTIVAVVEIGGNGSGSVQTSQSSHLTPRIQRSPSTRGSIINSGCDPSSSSTSSNLSSVHHPNHKTYIDHRSISSSHLMPAFAKRRIAATVAPQNIASGSVNAPSSYGANSPPEQFSETPTDDKDISYPGRVRGGKEHVYGYRQRGGDEHMSFLSPHREHHDSKDRLERTLESDHLGSVSSPGSVTNSRHSNQANIAHERRIGSGRLLPRDVNWDYRQEKDKNSANSSAEKDLSLSSHQSQQRNSGRFTERTHERGGFTERRSFERRGGGISKGEHTRDKFENSNSLTTQNTRRFTSNDVLNTSESASSNQHQPQQQVSYGRSRRNHQYNDRNEEPEWFSGGPTSQHDTIELRGFDEMDEHYSVNSISSKRKTTTSAQKLSEPSSRPNSSLNLLNPKLGKDQQHNSKEFIDNERESSVHNTESSVAVSRSDETVLTNVETFISNVNAPSKNGDTNNNNDSESQNKFEDSFLNAIEKDRNSTMKSTANEAEINFDVFFNSDPLEHTLMLRGNSHVGNAAIIGSSRFSRWFANKSNGDDAGGSEERNSDDLNEEQNKYQTHSLMQFLQRRKLPAPVPVLADVLHQHAIPSVEELEARMRKIDSNDVVNESSNTKRHENPVNAAASVEIQLQDNNDHASSVHSQPTQDMEAFRKLLEQLGSGNKQLQPSLQMNILLQQANRSAPTVSGVNMLQPSSVIAANSCIPPHILKNEEIKKFMLQQQMIHQQQHHPQKPTHTVVPPLNTLQHQPTSPQNLGIEISALPPQKRMEVQHLFQCVARGELGLSFLEQELNNPNTSSHAKDVIRAVLCESSRSVTPSGHMSGNLPPQVHVNTTGIDVTNQQQMHSPIPMGAQPIQQTCIPNAGIAIPNPQISKATIIGGHTELRTPPTQLSHQNAGLPSSRDIQFHTQAIMQNALLKKNFEEQQQQDVQRRRQEMQKPSQSNMMTIGFNEIDNIHQNSIQQQLQISTGMLPPMQPSSQPQPGQSHASHALQRHINSPTPLAFTPTSVLRKMTADKDNLNTQQQNAIPQAPQKQPQIQSKQPLAQTVFVNQQIIQQAIPPQPRMILGGNPQQQQLSNGVPHISPKTIQQQPPSAAQIRNASQIKWPQHIMNQSVPINKSMGRPILKGPLHVLGSQLQQAPQIQQLPQMTFASKLEFQQIQQQQRLKGNQTPQHMLNQSQQSVQTFPHPLHPPQHQSQPNIIAHVQQQQLFQQHQQRTFAIQCQQLQAQQQQLQQQHMDAGNRTMSIAPTSDTNSALATNNAAGIINYQRDGGLSPTSNQLAQWFSPELLAQASAGKLPLLNMNQALSLEEFERSIQHSSTAVHN